MSSAKESLVAPLRRRFPKLAPILILAPSQRCGSTLLQRAVNQAGDALIYGENFLLAESAPTLLCGDDVGQLPRKARIARSALQAFLQGDKGMDGSALFPDYVAYRRLLVGLFYQIAAFYQDQSARNGYARWGLKHQIRDLAGFRHFIEFIPDFRAVTIYRDVVPVADSMATRWPRAMATGVQCLEFGRRWQRNLDYLLSLDSERNLVLRYEDLVADPVVHVPRIESHLGVALSRSAFDKKVNTHGFDPHSGTPVERYVPPEPLDEQRRQAVVEGASPLYATLRYAGGDA